MRSAYSVGASSKPASNGSRTHSAHAEITQSDERQIHHVLSDITGLSGLAILDAILAGQRDCVKLAQLCHLSVKSPRDKIAQALEGDYRPEHLFVLQQSLSGYRYYQQQITELDRQIQQLMKAVGRSEDSPEEMPKRTKRTKRSESSDFRASGEGRALTRQTYRRRTYLVVLEVESARLFGDRSKNFRTLGREGRPLAISRDV
jgi:hypothetical protein